MRTGGVRGVVGGGSGVGYTNLHISNNNSSRRIHTHASATIQQYSDLHGHHGPGDLHDMFPDERWVSLTHTNAGVDMCIPMSCN